MAYILRSIAVIGVIALNSPVHGEKPADGGTLAAAHRLAKSAARIDAHGAVQGLTAAREAAQILAGLDPETRQRVLAMALPSGKGEREVAAKLR
jgi:hypothetical protein